MPFNLSGTIQPKISARLNNCAVHTVALNIPEEVAQFAANAEYDNGYKANYTLLKDNFADFYGFTPKEEFTWQLFSDILQSYNHHTIQLVLGPVLRAFIKTMAEQPGIADSALAQAYDELVDLDPANGRYESISPDLLYLLVAGPLGFNIKYHDETGARLVENRPDKQDEFLKTISIHHSGGLEGASAGGHWELTPSKKDWLVCTREDRLSLVAAILSHWIETTPEAEEHIAKQLPGVELTEEGIKAALEQRFSKQTTDKKLRSFLKNIGKALENADIEASDEGYPLEQYANQIEDNTGLALLDYALSDRRATQAFGLPILKKHVQLTGLSKLEEDPKTAEFDALHTTISNLDRCLDGYNKERGTVNNNLLIPGSETQMYFARFFQYDADEEMEPLVEDLIDLTEDSASTASQEEEEESLASELSENTEAEPANNEADTTPTKVEPEFQAEAEAEPEPKPVPEPEPELKSAAAAAAESKPDPKSPLDKATLDAHLFLLKDIEQTFYKKGDKERYAVAFVAAENLRKALTFASKAYFETHTMDLNGFRIHCLAAINKAQTVFSEHRGFKAVFQWLERFFQNLSRVFKSEEPAPAASRIRQSFFNTNSLNALGQLQDAIFPVPEIPTP